MKIRNSVYEGPSYLGIARVVQSFDDLVLIINGPKGDFFPSVIFTMRERKFSKIFSTNIGDRELSFGIKNKLTNSIENYSKKYPDNYIILCDSPTTSLLQENIQDIINSMKNELKEKIIFIDINPFRYDENQSASITLDKLFSFFYKKNLNISNNFSVNIIGSTIIGYNAFDNQKSLEKLMNDLNININKKVPLHSNINSLKYLNNSSLNLISNFETAFDIINKFKKNFQIPFIEEIPIGIFSMEKYINRISDFTKNDYHNYIISRKDENNFFWFKNIISSVNKYKILKALVFGDFMHSLGIVNILSELGIKIVCAGTYSVFLKDLYVEKIKNVKNINLQDIIISEDSMEIENKINELKPDIIFGTFIEERTARINNIPFVEISKPTRYKRPNKDIMKSRSYFGFEGVNNLISEISQNNNLFRELPITSGVMSYFGDSKKMNWSEKAAALLDTVPTLFRHDIIKYIEENHKNKNLDTVEYESYIDIIKNYGKF